MVSGLSARVKLHFLIVTVFVLISGGDVRADKDCFPFCRSGDVQSRGQVRERVQSAMWAR